MNIGINALYLIPGAVGGTEIYLRNLLAALAAIDTKNSYHVFTNRETRDLTPPGFTEAQQNVHAVNRPARLLWEQTALPRELRRRDIDCLLNPGFTAPALGPCPNVTVFHDLQHKRHPEHFRWFDLPAWNLFLGLSVRRSDLLLADSTATKQDLQRYYGVSEDRVRVVWLGVEDAFFRIAARRGAADRFLLCVSTLHPHKNIERLLRVFARFRERHGDWRLVVPGVHGFRTAAIKALMDELQLRGSVELPGWIPRDDLYDLYRRAAAFVYPSTFEGFGLPVLEAMAAGVPLACSDIEPLRTISAEGAWRFDPYDEEAMLAAIERAVNDASRVPAGLARAREFTWARCAEETLAAMRDVTERRKRP